MLQLEKYRGTRSRYKCPSCGHKNRFTKYIDDSGEYIDDSVGRCNRESSCGYHLTPKEYFERTGASCSFREQLNRVSKVNTSNAVNKMNKMNNLNTIEQFETIDNSFLVRSLEHSAANRFLRYLESFIDSELVFQMARRYFIGNTKDGRTVFWQIDRKGRPRTGKIISYVEATGKRDKQTNPSWVHYELKRHKLLPESFQHQLCFFGEHLLRTETRKPIAVVEAEKTAAIASIFINDFVWLAIGGKSYLKADKLRRFRGRKVVLFPDADGFDLWEPEAADARQMKLDITVSRVIEDSATAEERKSGFDLADYLIKSELAAQKWNKIVDDYNARVELVLSDQHLLDRFNSILDERKAVMMIAGNLSEMEAERILSDPANIRRVVMSL